MSELDKLQEYLKQRGYRFQRVDSFPSKQFLAACPIKEKGFGERHQIIVYKDDGNIWWDAICHWGSYGFEQGLLEIMGKELTNDDDSVEGYLTAEEIINRLEGL